MKRLGPMQSPLLSLLQINRRRFSLFFSLLAAVSLGASAQAQSNGVSCEVWLNITGSAVSD
ncbi:MAG TPA: hypothetical protein VN673_02965, partial [Clostridia bacterium]|nr:hypothetical protein [Clostridia bacterium]